MNDQMEVSIEYPNGCIDGATLVTPLGSDRYRLDRDPLSCLMAANDHELRRLPNYRDIIEATTLKPNVLKFVRVAERASLRKYDWVLSRDSVGSEGLRKVLLRVESEGGHWDRVFGGILVIYIPTTSPYDPTGDMKQIHHDA